MKNYIFSFALLFLVSRVDSNWLGATRFENFNEYFPNLLQETVYELEKYGWHNFKLNDQFTTIDQKIYDRLFQGQVNYTNGFLVSIQKIDATGTAQSFTQSSLSNFTVNGRMQCKLSFRSVVLGYDVSADLGDEGTHWMTGSHWHNEIRYDLQILKNMNTSEITTSVRLESLSSNIGLVMEYAPPSDIGEVLSRFYVAGSTWNGLSAWGMEIISPAILTVINRIGIPRACFMC